MGRKFVSPLAKIFFKGYISHWFIEHSGDFIHPIRFPRSMKKWINKPAEWFVTLIYQEHCEEQVRISESRKTLRNWIVKAPKTGTPETKIKHLAKEQRPLQLLVDGFVRHAGPANPNVCAQGRGQASVAPLACVPCSAWLAGISLQRPHNLTEQYIEVFMKVYLLPCREYFLLSDRNVKVCIGDVPQR